MVLILGWVTLKGYWPYLWREWITSVDHKRIGVMYIVLALIMLLRGFSDAIMMRAQQAVAAGGAQGYLPPEHFDQIFSAHGTIMIFFMAMPFVIGLMNFVVPLQLGVRDMAFPTLNSVALGLTASGILLINISLAVGEFAKNRLGRLSAAQRAAILARRRRRLLPVGAADLRHRHLADGNQFRHHDSENAGTRHGLYAHAGVLLDGACLEPAHRRGLSGPDRDLRDAAARPLSRLSFLHGRRRQGNPMMYVNLFWVWGHPEVYILVLPAFGIFSEVVATFSGKPLFGYRSMVAATMAICVLSFFVWLHHFFTMGASADVNGFFGVMTMIIAVPTGVKVFNWLFTMYGGRVRFTVPVLWSIGFMVTFVIGGMTGVLMAVPPADFQLHNSLFLVAHFHNVIIGGVVFGVMAGYNYWFPKAFGFTLDERWGKASFWCWLVGFYLAFMPLYVLGLMGMTRRMQHYDNLDWQPWLHRGGGRCRSSFWRASSARSCSSSSRSATASSIRDVTGDPWNGRTLEWSTASPPPAWNFAVLPQVVRERRLLEQQATRAREQGEPAHAREYKPIEMPKNSATGFVTAFFAVVTGFALIWHIWWMAGCWSVSALS